MQIRNATVLATLGAREDRLSLSEAFGHSGWILVVTGSLEEAMAVLRSILIGVVLCDVRLPGGYTWRDLMTEMKELGDPPPLIVADRLADECLWLEALNFGAYDLLAKPFDSKEVLRAVTAACRRHENRSRLGRERRKPEAGSRDSKEAARAMSASA
jgi:DNA-binding response OmpR family regulator